MRIKNTITLSFFSVVAYLTYLTFLTYHTYHTYHTYQHLYKTLRKRLVRRRTPRIGLAPPTAAPALAPSDVLAALGAGAGARAASILLNSSSSFFNFLFSACNCASRTAASSPAPLGAESSFVNSILLCTFLAVKEHIREFMNENTNVGSTPVLPHLAGTRAPKIPSNLLW